MKKIPVLLLALGAFTVVSAQDSTVIDPLTDTVPQVIDTLPITDPNVLMEETEEENKQKRKLDINQLKLANRSKDHLLIQVGFDGWSQIPDSINTGGLPRSFNMYFMFDFPFKTDPRFSVGAGLGIGSSNIFFNKQWVKIADNAPTLAFTEESQTDHFKKFKLVTTYLEVPVELRFALDPENTNKSWKFAVGAKVGLMLSAHTKGKTRQNSFGQTIGNYTRKDASKQYFNSTKLAATARISKGVFGVFAQYQVNTLIKAAYGPSVFPFSFGIQLSGL